MNTLFLIITRALSAIIRRSPHPVFLLALKIAIVLIYKNWHKAAGISPRKRIAAVDGKLKNIHLD